MNAIYSPINQRAWFTVHLTSCYFQHVQPTGAQSLHSSQVVPSPDCPHQAATTATIRTLCANPDALT